MAEAIPKIAWAFVAGIIIVLVGGYVASQVYHTLYHQTTTVTTRTMTQTKTITSTATVTATERLTETQTITATTTITQPVTKTTTVTRTVTQTVTPEYAVPHFVVLKNETLTLQPNGIVPAFIEAYPLGGFGDFIVKWQATGDITVSVNTGFTSKLDGYRYSLDLKEVSGEQGVLWGPFAGCFTVNIYNKGSDPVTAQLVIAARYVIVNATGYGYVERGVLPPPSPGHDTISN